MVIRVKTSHRIAAQSVDHMYPRGTKNDTSDNIEFDLRLIKLVEKVRLLDLGCSGGTFVESIGGFGHFAVGIDGSDYSQKAKRASWERIPHRLFTADIGKPFVVMNEDKRQMFNVITAWEVLEHLTEEELTILNFTLHAHLDDLRLFIGSITTVSDLHNGHEYHATRKPYEWWRDWFQANGWIWCEDIIESFHPHWVRGFVNSDISFPFVVRMRP